MDLWIRSQDKCNLFLLKHSIYIECQDSTIWSIKIRENNGWLGTYKSEKRAIEILDEIQSILKPPKIKVEDINKETIESIKNNYPLMVFNDDSYNIYPLQTYVYEMPEE